MVSPGPGNQEIWNTYDANKRKKKRNNNDDLFTGTQGLNENFLGDNEMIFIMFIPHTFYSK